jgi:hypothetical protein
MKRERKQRSIPVRPPGRRRGKSAQPEVYEPASFLNIDVDVRSRRSLAALAAAWPWAQRPFQNSRWLVFSARGHATTADATAQELIEQVHALPRAARRAWDLASTRTFDIGVQAGISSRPFEKVTLAAETLARIASIRARIKVTVYPPQIASV